MKQLFFFIFGFVFLTNLHCQDDVSFLSANLVPYSEKSDILENPLMENIMYTQLYTGAGDFFKCYIGTGIYKGNTIYWAQYDFVTKKEFSILNVEKDDEKNMCSGTVKRTFKQDANMIAFEFKHNLTTNEIQYIWLDWDNGYSENAVVISEDKAIKKGKMFPDMILDKLDRETLSIHDFAGKIIVINWWAIECRPCRAEMPGLNRLVEQYKDNPNVVFIAIADNDKDRLPGFLYNHEFNYIQTLASQEARALFDPGYPQHIIIDSTGEIYHHSSGGKENIYLKIDEKIKELLGGKTI